MIHFVCDVCKRSIDSEDVRFVVRMEVYAAPDPTGGEREDDRDHLSEIHESLERLEDGDDCELDAGASQQLRFDLCEACRKNFLLDPLGRRIAQPLDFSKN
jgi:hypothetical protein